MTSTQKAYYMKINVHHPRKKGLEKKKAMNFRHH